MVVKILSWVSAVLFILVGISSSRKGNVPEVILLGSAAALISPPSIGYWFRFLRWKGESSWPGTLTLGVVWMLILLGLGTSESLAGQEIEDPAGQETERKTDQEITQLKDKMAAAQTDVQVQPGSKLDPIYTETVRERALVLWRQLEVARHLPRYHQNGFGGNGAMSNWIERCDILVQEWRDYAGTLPKQERARVELLLPILFMKEVRLVWTYAEGGNDIPSQDSMITEIERVIVGGDLLVQQDE